MNWSLSGFVASRSICLDRGIGRSGNMIIRDYFILVAIIDIVNYQHAPFLMAAVVATIHLKHALGVMRGYRGGSQVSAFAACKFSMP